MDENKVCLICNKNLKNNVSLSTHIQLAHKMKCIDYTLKYLYNNIRPLCFCGCNQETRYYSFEFNKFRTGHNSYKSSGLSNNFNKNGLPKGAQKWADFRKGKAYEEIFGEEKAKQLKCKKREYRLKKYIENNECLSIGKNETKLLNEQEIKDNCKILRQYFVLGLHYIVDGYDKKNNTVYEVYESFHENRIEYDLRRQKEIEEKLNCRFIIIKDNLEN